jgi:hypothetical protein
MVDGMNGNCVMTDDEWLSNLCEMKEALCLAGLLCLIAALLVADLIIASLHSNLFTIIILLFVSLDLKRAVGKHRKDFGSGLCPCHFIHCCREATRRQISQ